MGMVRYEVTFEGGAPDLARVADKAAELSGLPIKVTQRPHEDGMIAMHGDFAFEVAAETAIELYSYFPGAVKRWVEGDGRGLLVPQAYGHLQGYNEEPGKQTVYLDWYVGQEPTLSLFIVRALQELGGKLAHPLSEASRGLCNKPIEEEELHRRRREADRNARAMNLAGAFFLPLSLLAVPFSILLLPFQLTRRRMNQAVELSQEASREQAKADDIGRLKYAFMMLCVLPSWAFAVIFMLVGVVALIPCMPFYLAYRIMQYLRPSKRRMGGA